MIRTRELPVGGVEVGGCGARGDVVRHRRRVWGCVRFAWRPLALGQLRWYSWCGGWVVEPYDGLRDARLMKTLGRFGDLNTGAGRATA